MLDTAQCGETRDPFAALRVTNEVNLKICDVSADTKHRALHTGKKVLARVDHDVFAGDEVGHFGNVDEQLAIGHIGFAGGRFERLRHRFGAIEEDVSDAVEARAGVEVASSTRCDWT